MTGPEYSAPDPTPDAASPPPLPPIAPPAFDESAPPAEPVPTAPTLRPEDEVILFAPPPAADKWPHRRGEPRMFALVWTIFLLGSTVAAYASLMISGVLDPLAARYAGRQLIAAIAVALVLLWPLIRLSQIMPREGGVAAVTKDLFVVVVPTQAVVWPLTMLALWPIATVSAVALLLFSWTLLLGAILAIALGRPHRAEVQRAGGAFSRILWLCAFLALLCTGPILAATRQAPDAGAHLPALLSPVSGALELVKDRSWTGRTTVVYPEHWAAIGITFLAAIALWLAASARERGTRHAQSLPLRFPTA